MLKPIFSSPSPIVSKPTAVARPRQAESSVTARVDSSAHEAADEVRSGPPRTVESEAVMGLVKVATSRQEAERDILAMRLQPGEIRRENGDVVTVEAPARHTVKHPDGSMRQTDLEGKATRVNETAQDGSSTMYYADGQGGLTIERRDAAGNVTESHHYGQEQPPQNEPPFRIVPPAQNVGPFGVTMGISGLGLRPDGTVVHPPQHQGGLRLSMGVSGYAIEVGG